MPDWEQCVKIKFHEGTFLQFEPEFGEDFDFYDDGYK
jgi:hypothetical protein